MTDEKNPFLEIQRVLEQGGAVMSGSKECTERMAKRGEKPDFTVTKAALDDFYGTSTAGDPQEYIVGGFTIAWETQSAGFGNFSIWLDGEGKLHCDNERMSPRFVKEVFSKLVDSMVFEDLPTGKPPAEAPLESSKLFQDKTDAHDDAEGEKAP